MVESSERSNSEKAAQDIYVAFLEDRANMNTARPLLRDAGYRCTMDRPGEQTWRIPGKLQIDWTFHYDLDGRIYRVEMSA